MTFFIRKLRFKKTLFRKRTYILFEFYLGDKWRKGKVLFNCTNPLSSISYVSGLVISYITNFISSKHSVWSLEDIKLMTVLTDHFSKDIVKDSIKLFK